MHFSCLFLSNLNMVKLYLCCTSGTAVKILPLWWWTHHLTLQTDLRKFLAFFFFFFFGYFSVLFCVWRFVGFTSPCTWSWWGCWLCAWLENQLISGPLAAFTPGQRRDWYMGMVQFHGLLQIVGAVYFNQSHSACSHWIVTVHAADFYGACTEAKTDCFIFCCQHYCKDTMLSMALTLGW